MRKNILKPDFSGTWELDFKRSNLQSPPPKSMIFDIDHKEPNWSVERTIVYESGEENFWEIETTTDGEELVQNYGDYKIKARIYWQNEVLIFDSEIISPNGIGSNVVQYTLTDNGKTMVAEEKYKSKSDNHYNRWVYNN